MKTRYKLLVLIFTALAIAIIVWVGSWGLFYAVVGFAVTLLGGMWAIDAWVLEYPVIRPFARRLFGKQKYIAVILAAGMSKRWCESIESDSWRRDKERMAYKGFSGPYRDPDDNQGKHKALATLGNSPLIKWSLTKLSKAKITDIIVTASSKSTAQTEIIHWIGQWNSSSSPRVTVVLVHGESDITASVYEGLASIKGYEGY